MEQWPITEVWNVTSNNSSPLLNVKEYVYLTIWRQNDNIWNTLYIGLLLENVLVQ